jgi:hypothetical protein
MAEPFLWPAPVFGLATSDPGWENTVFIVCTNAENGYGSGPNAWPLNQSTVQPPSRAVRGPHRTNLGACGDFPLLYKGLKEWVLHIKWRIPPENWGGDEHNGPVHASRFGRVGWHGVREVVSAQDYPWSNIFCWSGCGWAVVVHVYSRRIQRH